MDRKYPWLVVENLEAEGDKEDHIFYPIHDPLSQYKFQIPRGRIWGCFYGWVILSNNLMWSIWNPLTCKVIHLPPLILKGVDSESIEESCLCSPPDDPRSLLMLTIYEKPIIVFCRLDNRLGWTEMSYAKQLRSLELPDDICLYCLSCCNGKVYSLISRYGNLVIQVDVHVAKDQEVVIHLLRSVVLPYRDYNRYSSMISFLKGSCVDQLFYIELGFDEVSLASVYLYKLDMTRMKWEELQDLKDAVFFLDLAHEDLVYYHPAVASELGGYIHILGKNGKALHSLHVKDKILSLSSMPSFLVSSSRLSLWECTRLPSHHGEIKCRADSEPADGNGDIIMLDISSTANEEDNESHLLNVPLYVLEMIMELCVGVEYLNFRATCKACKLGAPMIRWSKEATICGLQTPWLVVVNHHQGLITFTDPVSSDNYFITTPRELNGDMRILCSGYGWLLMMMVQPFVVNGTRKSQLVFFNPFTRDIRKLPDGVPVNMFSFSAPPTSPDCVVVGFSKRSQHVYIHFVAGEPYWRMLLVDANPHSLRFPTFRGPNLYALCKDRGLFMIRDLEDIQDYSWEPVTAKAPTSSSTQYFLVKGDEHFLLVKMGEFGEDIQVFKLNEATKEWERIDGLGRHMIYICDTTCICIEAKTQEMENKIYFPRLHSENRKIVFYSLETCSFQTSDGKCTRQNLFGTQHHTYTHTWIQPSWS